jgi:hypothetical protein
MTTLSRIVPIATASGLSIGAAVALVSWSSMNVHAQQTSLCYQRCTTQYGWTEPQCARYCRRADSQPRVYGYVRRSDGERGYSGGCGTYRYWNGSTCLDARDAPAR